MKSNEGPNITRIPPQTSKHYFFFQNKKWKKYKGIQKTKSAKTPLETVSN